MSKTILKLLGWRVHIEPILNIKKSVIIAAPHTSNWDFIIGILAAKACKIRVKFIIKKEWNLPIIGLILRFFGAIFVNRSKAQGVTASIIDTIKAMPEGHIVFTPEGTRSPVQKWRSGFYHIAYNSHTPISVGYLNYTEKVIGIDHILYPSGNIASDCDVLRHFYKDIPSKHPENYISNWGI